VVATGEGTAVYTRRETGLNPRRHILQNGLWGFTVSDWIDISLPVYSGMVVWPGDSEVRVERVMKLENGDPFNLTQCSFTAHTGTHVDAPRHFLAQGEAVDALPLDAVLGPCRVVQIQDPEAVRPAELPDDLQPGDRVLFKTSNSLQYSALQRFVETFVYVSKEAAKALVAVGVRTVGIDYLSVGGFSQDLAETHLILLGAGIWIIEGLDLSNVEPGRYELACLPLRLVGADGAPARAALRKI
jgi:arylformamidase